jgi:K+ transporter
MPTSAISAASRSSRLVRSGAAGAVLNYFGQGALCCAIRRDRQSVLQAGARNVPPADGRAGDGGDGDREPGCHYGAYSLTYQAIQLGLLPRLAILHTSEAHFGQIYIPRVNTALLAGVLLLVLMFRTSSQLASAYGIAVTTTMVVDGVLGFIVIWKLWKWKWWSAALLVVPLVVVDATFLSANLLNCSRAPGRRCCSVPPW